MAKAPTKKDTGTKVTRITASDSGKALSGKSEASKPVKVKPAIAKTNTAKKTGPANASQESATKNPFVRFSRYFKGAWHELRQVRWPDRKNTWAMTGALLAFTAFFIVVILVLDFAFSELFKLILGSN